MSSNFTYIRSRRSRSYRTRLFKLQLINKLITFGVIGAIGLFIFTFFLFIWYSRDLPSPDSVQRKEGFSTVILDKNGKTIYDIYNGQNRIPVTFSDIPDFLKKATVSIEDKNFYEHQGFDPKGIVRAFLSIITFRGIQGGSTLTQQLVKNVLLSSEQTVTRKIKEFILAVQIERKYSKDQILQMYLNEAPYGGTMWGIESAAEGYFGKHAKDLTQIECAILAGLPQSPTYYSPFSGNKYVERTKEVLIRMMEDGKITPQQESDLEKQLPQVKFQKPSSQFIAPHFVLYIKQQLVDKFGEKAVNEEGLRVITTLDSDLQLKTQNIVGEELDKLKSLNVSNGAVLVINPQTGGILAYVGSRDYDAADPKMGGKFDVVSMGYRQPGSALKPITYATAFEKGYTPASLLMDTETHFPAGAGRPDYIPHNYDGKFRGPVQIRYALANSINVPAVKTTALVGVRDILKNAYAMGLSTLPPTDENLKRLGLSMTLGGGEVRLLDLTQAYGVFATGGIKNDVYSIEKVEDSTGKVLYEHKPIEGKRVLPPDISFLVSDILSDNEARKMEFGLNSYLHIPGKTVAAKTGTTDDKRDNWTMGYTPNVVVGVWVGNNDNSPMDQSLASGITGAAPIWNRVMQAAITNSPNQPFGKPDNVISLTIDVYGGGLPHGSDPTRSEYFIKGTEPTDVSPIYQKIKLSKSDNNKLANAVEIAKGNYVEKEFVVFKEADPVSSDGKNRWQEGIDSWVSQQSDPKFHPPTDMSNVDSNSVVVNIKSPSDQSQTDSNSVHVQAEGKAIKDIKKMELYIDGSQKDSVNSNSLDETLNLDTGIHKIGVKAYDADGNTSESDVTIGVKTSPNPTATPVPQPTPTLVSIPTSSP